MFEEFRANSGKKYKQTSSVCVTVVQCKYTKVFFQTVTNVGYEWDKKK
jgi:hypothetical protein